MKNKDIFTQLIEKASAEACEMIDRVCFDMLKQQGYNTNNLPALKRQLNKEKREVIMVYGKAENNGDLFAFWEFYQCDKKWVRQNLICKSQAVVLKVNQYEEDKNE